MQMVYVQRSCAALIATAIWFLGCEQSVQEVDTGAGAAGTSATSIAGSGGSGGAGLSGSGGAGAAGAPAIGGSGGNRADTGTTIEQCSITTPTTWGAGVYVANCNIEVSAGLTIDPGAIIKFGSGHYLTVLPAGTLTAVGSDAQPIIFTSLGDDEHGGDTNGDGASTGARNDWGCQDTCGALNIQGSGSVLDHVQTLYASSGIYIQGDGAQVRKSTFAHHASYGMVLDGRFPVGATQLTENTFFDNQGYPLRVGKPVFIDASNVFHDPANPNTKNGKQCIELDTDLDQLVVLGVSELAFLFSGHRFSAEVLTPPGVIFKAKDAAIYMDAGGSLFNGPNAIFTSYKDDSLGGDCTGDGASTPAVGDWEGLWIDDGSQADYSAPVDYVRYPAKSGTQSLH